MLGTSSCQAMCTEFTETVHCCRLQFNSDALTYNGGIIKLIVLRPHSQPPANGNYNYWF